MKIDVDSTVQVLLLFFFNIVSKVTKLMIEFNLNKLTMKKLLVLLMSVATLSATSQVAEPVRQTNPQQQTQPAPQKVVYVQKPAFTPHLRLNAYTLYAFDDKVESYYDANYYYSGKIKGGFEWGGALEYMLHPAQSIELSYLRLDSKALITDYNLISNSYDIDLASNYIMIGSNRYFGMNPKVEPYAGINLGMVVFSAENTDTGKTGSATKFAWGLKAGLNIWASEKVGIKLQGGLLSAVQGAGGGLYFGTGGAGAGVSTYSSFYQFHLGGGLTFNLSK